MVPAGSSHQFIEEKSMFPRRIIYEHRSAEAGVVVAVDNTSKAEADSVVREVIAWAGCPVLLRVAHRNRTGVGELLIDFPGDPLVGRDLPGLAWSIRKNVRLVPIADRGDSLHWRNVGPEPQG
jgi:hypothetical protein